MKQQIAATTPRVPLVTSAAANGGNDRIPSASVRVVSAQFTNDRGAWEIRFV